MSADEAREQESPRYGLVIDLDRCMGCRACEVACKVENNTPEGILWMHVFRWEIEEYPNTRVAFLPRPCQHCDNPPCVKVCPVGARFKQENGLVLTDFDRCIGERFCQVACPYGVNYFNWSEPDDNQYLDWGDTDLAPLTGGASPPYENPLLHELYGTPDKRRVAGGGHYRGVIEKCTLCVHRIAEGLEPACVVTCPVDAIVFGDLEDPDSAPSQLLREKPEWCLLAEAGTQVRVHEVGGAAPEDDWRPIELVKGRA